MKRLILYNLLILIAFILISCGFKKDDPGSDIDEDTATIMEINRTIVDQEARQMDASPFVSRSYNYAGLEYDEYLASLSPKPLVVALFEDLQDDNITLVSYTVTLEDEEIVRDRDSDIIHDTITVGITLRGTIALDTFFNLNIPSNTVFTGKITSTRQLDFIKDLDGMWRFIAERNIFSELVVSGGEYVDFQEFSYSPMTQISPGDELFVSGRVKRGNSYMIKIDWGYSESGSEDLIDGANFETSYRFIANDGVLPQGFDSIILQTVGCIVSLDIITGFHARIFQIPVLPLENGPSED